MEIAKTAPDALKLLWRDGFFKQERVLREIEEELARREHHFPTSTLARALSETKFLARFGSKGTYRYIQKYPYSE